MPDKNLGTAGNSLAGILGGGLGGALLQALGIFAQSGGLSLGGILGDVASGGVGGAILLFIISLIRGASARTA
jgi:uncharacterized membrane protein YeaQ/YmgE (transglycosylase-associated protein family)